jgi:hypothetical protein
MLRVCVKGVTVKRVVQFKRNEVLPLFEFEHLHQIRDQIQKLNLKYEGLSKILPCARRSEVGRFGTLTPIAAEKRQ